MADSYEKQRIIKLDNVSQNNIVLVDLNQETSDPLFSQEYKKVSSIIQRIIAECAKEQYDDTRRSLKNNKTANDSLKEYHTVIPFIGERGTGKTSTMCSVLEWLRDFHGDSNGSMLDLGSKNDNVRFIVFKMIDTTVLGSNEDVMEIILSRMLNYLEELNADSDFRELYRQIDELYSDLRRIRLPKGERPEEYGLTALQRIADSQKTIESFRKLVKDFTKGISHFQCGDKPCYLVIALDDIDLTQGKCINDNDFSSENQYKLLEYIYDYMRIPGLILLVTYNELILRRRCNQHFAKVYYGKEPPNDMPPQERREVETLTAQFLSKLFPEERRIYVPNYLFVNGNEHPNLYVNPLINAKTGEVLLPFSGDERPSIKEFMLRLIAYKTDVYFDGAGTKRHFFEPRNLREFGELYQVLNAMENVGSVNDEPAKAQNRQILLEYFYNQYALKHLLFDEYRQFSKLAMLPLSKQKSSLIDTIRGQRMENVSSTDSLGYLDITRKERWKYSFGDLIQNLYFSSRVKKRAGNGDYLQSKEFIHCILGTNSIILNQFMHRCDSAKISEFVGPSIAASLADNMLPECINETHTGMGNFYEPVRTFFDWEIPDEVVNAILDMSHSSSEQEYPVLHNYIESLVIVGMLFTAFPTGGLKLTVKPEVIENGQTRNKDVPVMFLSSSSLDVINFNVLNFVVNLLPDSQNRVQYLDIMQKKLVKLGNEILSELNRDWGNEEISVKNKLEDLLKLKKENERSLVDNNNYIGIKRANDMYVIQKGQLENDIIRANVWSSCVDKTKFNEGEFLKKWNSIVNKTCETIRQSIEEWQKAYPHLLTVLPVQHFDMMYNIIKRLSNGRLTHGSYYDVPSEVQVEESFDYVVRLYNNALQELKKQDEIYHDNVSFEQAFRDSVFYKKFADEHTRNVFVKRIYIEMMKKVTYNVALRNAHTSIRSV